MRPARVVERDVAHKRRSCLAHRVVGPEIYLLVLAIYRPRRPGASPLWQSIATFPSRALQFACAAPSKRRARTLSRTAARTRRAFPSGERLNLGVAPKSRLNTAAMKI